MVDQKLQDLDLSAMNGHGSFCCFLWILINYGDRILDLSRVATGFRGNRSTGLWNANYFPFCIIKIHPSH